tara:strand:- start:5 stop:391 length:387 start_codon:yes stop_codon:yes gene_type:complete
MTIGVLEAIQSLKPNASFGMRGVKPDATVSEQYNAVIWQDESQTKPTEDEVTAKVTELNNELPMKLLREERDRRLQATDWRASSDLNLPESWRAYRQALRDLPANAKPKLDENEDLDMSSVAWPSPST